MVLILFFGAYLKIKKNISQQCKQQKLISRALPVLMQSSTNTRTNMNDLHIDHSLPDVLFDVYMQYVEHCQRQQNNQNKTMSPAMQLHWTKLEKRLQRSKLELCSITHIVLHNSHVDVRTRDAAHMSKTTRCLVEKACARFVQHKFYSLQENSTSHNTETP